MILPNGLIYIQKYKFSFEISEKTKGLTG